MYGASGGATLPGNARQTCVIGHLTRESTSPRESEVVADNHHHGAPESRPDEAGLARSGRRRRRTARPRRWRTRRPHRSQWRPSSQLRRYRRAPAPRASRRPSRTKAPQEPGRERRGHDDDHDDPEREPPPVVDLHREPDREAHLGDEERREPGHERVARQHEEHVPQHAEDERDAEPRSGVGVHRVERDRGREERERRRRLADVLDPTPIGRDRPPVGDRERRREPEAGPRERRSAHRPEEAPHVVDEEVGLLQRGEVAASRHVGPADDVVAGLRPRPREAQHLSRETPPRRRGPRHARSARPRRRGRPRSRGARPSGRCR